MTAANRLFRLAPDFLQASNEANPARLRKANPAAITSNDDADALTRLETLMSEVEVWRGTGLTIKMLANHAGVPEYRLRRLINQRLGFRNFTAFLNEYRLAAAAEKLADRAEKRSPILTIALDLGWGSIGPFNRAFRARFGRAPSDYRRDGPRPEAQLAPDSRTTPNLTQGRPAL
jgi:AraC-like DNA-binding protein